MLPLPDAFIIAALAAERQRAFLAEIEHARPVDQVARAGRSRPVASRLMAFVW